MKILLPKPIKMSALINNDTTTSSEEANSTIFLDSLLDLFSRIENMSHDFRDSDGFSPALAAFFSSIFAFEKELPTNLLMCPWLSWITS